MPFLGNVLLTTARAAYNAGTGQTGQATSAYLSGVVAAVEEFDTGQLMKLNPDAAKALEAAEYQATVDSGTDISAGDEILAIVLRTDGVTAWPGDLATSQVNTTGSAIAATGSQVCTPASMANIAVGTPLLCDNGSASAEKVVVSAVTGTTFTAVFAQTHSANFPIAAVALVWRVLYARETSAGLLPERLVYFARVPLVGPLHR